MILTHTWRLKQAAGSWSVMATKVRWDAGTEIPEIPELHNPRSENPRNLLRVAIERGNLVEEGIVLLESEESHIHPGCTQPYRQHYLLRVRKPQPALKIVNVDE